MSALDDLGDLGDDGPEEVGPAATLAVTPSRFAGLPNLPALIMLMGLAQWVAWASRRKPGVAKPTKVPINPATGRAASTKDATTWGSYEAAADRARRDSLAGVGIVLTVSDNLTGVDLDNCRDPATGALSSLAAKVLALGETYAEVSPSGCGIRLFALGKVDHPRKDDGAGIEVYESGRYLTVTGQRVDGAPDTINPAPQTLALLGYDGRARMGARAPRPGVASRSAIVLPTVDLEPPKPSALGRECAAFWQLAEGRKTQREPAWRLMLDLARHTTAGDALAHELSKDHPGYSPGATQEKLDKLKAGGFGPPTCGFVENSLGTSAPCASCPHHGNPNTSPIAIARRATPRTVTTGDGTAIERPVIIVEGGEIATVADAAAAALLAAGTPIFVRSGRLVRPVQDEVPASRGRTTRVARLAEIKVPALVDLLARGADFQRWSARSGSYLRIDPPRQVAEILLAREGSWPFAPVVGVITAPTMRGDGTILQAPGYDAASRLFHLPTPGLNLTPIADPPTRRDAQDALALLDGLLDGFPFVDALDRAVALSGLLTAVLRAGMATAPLHLFRAHTAGTGKSFLVDVAATIATGRPCPVSSVGTGPEELEKRLVALLLGGSPMVSLDNINGEVGGDVLCQVVERPLVSLRPLGVSEVREVECRAAVFATGNNTTVRGDMFRRTVTCNLDARIERPELRRFGFDPVDRILSDRGRYVAAALTIARFGRSASGTAAIGPLGSYEDWSATVRAPLVALGLCDPAASMDLARTEDPELVAIRELFSHWEAAAGLALGEFYRTSQVEAASLQHDGPPMADSDFRSSLLRQFGAAGAVSTLKFGKFLRRIHGRVVDGYRLEMRPDAKHGHMFALVKLAAT